MRQMPWIAIDAGQTGVRVRSSDGREEGYPGVLTDQPLPAQLAGVARQFIEAHAPETQTVTIGSSGLTVETAHDVLGLLHGSGVRTVVLAHDSITCYLGALGLERGAMIASGTGTICMALGEHEVARVDGWGYLMGDAGSAYWIGRTALEAAMRGYDGRRMSTALTSMVQSDFDDIETAYVELQSDPYKVSRIAAYARRVDELAAFDRVAGNILDKAAAHLSEAVQAAVRRVGLGAVGCPRVAAIGNVFNSDRVLRTFTDYLTLQWPDFAVVDPQGDTLDGAAALREVPVNHPFFSRVSTAEGR